MPRPSSRTVKLTCSPGASPRADAVGSSTRRAAVVGCGALALKTGYGEVKSMFVAPEARGARIGERILDRIVAEARAEGLPLLRLETGDKLASAHALYERAGFRYRGPFGEYEDGPHSVFMEMAL